MKNTRIALTLVIIFVLMFLSSVHPAMGQDIIGKVITGYQGWFSCQDDESPFSGWRHWGKGSNMPTTGFGNLSFELYPDMREYSTSYQAGFANLGNGQAAKLFSSYDDQVVDTHVKWMAESGIDVAALQRFGHSIGNSDIMGHKDGMARKVRSAAEKYDRKFFIMYDLSSWTDFQTELKTDWTNVIAGELDLLSSPSYAREDGKPVVCVWGFGCSGRPGNQASWTDVINYLKDQGCFVIAGCHKYWRTTPEMLGAVQNADMIAPWYVGTFSKNSIDNWYEDKVKPDIEYCAANGLHFMPCVWPGFAWSNWKTKDGVPTPKNQHPRLHGEYLWKQFYLAKQKFNEVEGTTATVYVAMFDEYDEATAIAKAAEDVSMIPTDQYFLTLDADGVHCSSDFYLRLTADGAKMIKGEIELSSIHPTPHVPGTTSNSNIHGGINNGNSEVKIFPNPASGVVKINTNRETIDIELFDLSGKQVIQKMHFFADAELDMSNIKAGVYVLKVDNSFHKLIIK